MVKRIYVEKKKGCDVAAAKTKADILGVLGIEVKDVRQFIRYDIEGLEEDIFEKALNTIFSEPPVDNVYIDELPGMEGYKLLVTEYLPGSTTSARTARCSAYSCFPCAPVRLSSARPCMPSQARASGIWTR